MNKTLIVFFTNADSEFFNVSKLTDAKYWIERRIEKSNKYPEKAWLVDDSAEINVQEIIDNYEEECFKYQQQIKEQEERKLLIKLKEKYEL